MRKMDCLLLKACLLMIMLLSSCHLKAQSEEKMNIIVTINNTFIRDGEIKFIVGTEHKDTIRSEYYLGNVCVSEAESQLLDFAEKCDMEFSFIDGGKDGLQMQTKKYYIPSVFYVSQYRVFILTLYDTGKKKDDYDFGYFGNFKNSCTFHERVPKNKKNFRKNNELTKNMLGNSPIYK